MTPEEEQALRQEKSLLQAQVQSQQELIDQQAQQITLLSAQVQELQARLSKDSHNSHLPPSSDRFGRQPRSLRKKSGKKPGGQPGHPGQMLRMVEQPDTVITHRVECCPACQHDLRAVDALQVERRQVIELPRQRVVVIEHQAEHKCCPTCQEVILAPFPAEVIAPVQHGPALGAFAVYLVQQQLLPYERVSELFFDLFGHPIAPATVMSLVERCAGQLVEVEHQLKTALAQAEVLHQDETGLSVGGKRHWVHVSATPTLTHYAVHAKRGKEALDAIGILPGFKGVSVHDGWRSYWAYDCQHATCNVHLLRDLTFLIEEHHQEWAQQMKDLLLAMKAAVEQARADGRVALHPTEVADWQAQYQAVLLEGEAAQPRDLSPPPQGKGRRKQSAARNLLDRLSKEQDAVLAFLLNVAVPFDNNLAERDLRMIKVQQKISGCFRRFAGAEAFCRIRGYLSTLRKQGRALLTALEQVLLGHPVLPDFTLPE
jgi:transposase